MLNITEVENNTKTMVDKLKVTLQGFGLLNSASEHKIITSAFLYKFLNDKFLYEIRKTKPEFKNETNLEKKLNELSDDKYELLLMKLPANTAKLKREYFLSNLFNNKNKSNFHEIFDDTLTGIANDNIDIFSVHTGSGDKIKLFDQLSVYVTDTTKKDDFCRSLVDDLIEFSFENIFEQKYDFFSKIFEYLIKDYNKDSGEYAEYYTPQAIASIIAKIMVKPGDKNVTIYDPAAGSGTLVLAVAHEIGENNCSIFTQDISQKSNEFLRLNLILNNLVHSLQNVVHDNTLTNPKHLDSKDKNKLATFHYIVSNPPFKSNFSKDRDALAGEKHAKRFFAGVPKIPNAKKESMAIYLCFIQHILYSLKDGGKAAVVVPTGFLTAQAGIEKKIREHIVNNHWLRGVVSMPSNIFANTGTNVSILFIDKTNQDGDVLLVNASKLGEKVKVGKNQKTVLSQEELDKIVNTFVEHKIEEDFSVSVTYDQIKEKNYSFSAGQYFDVKIEYVELTQEEFNGKMQTYTNNLNKLFAESKSLEDEIRNNLKGLKYE